MDLIPFPFFPKLCWIFSLSSSYSNQIVLPMAGANSFSALLSLLVVLSCIMVGQVFKPLLADSRQGNLAAGGWYFSSPFLTMICFVKTSLPHSFRHSICPPPLLFPQFWVRWCSPSLWPLFPTWRWPLPVLLPSVVCSNALLLCSSAVSPPPQSIAFPSLSVCCFPLFSSFSSPAFLTNGTAPICRRLRRWAEAKRESEKKWSANQREIVRWVICTIF